MPGGREEGVNEGREGEGGREGVLHSNPTLWLQLMNAQVLWQ